MAKCSSIFFDFLDLHRARSLLVQGKFFGCERYEIQIFFETE